MKNSTAFLKKNKVKLYNPAIPLLGIYQRKLNTNSKRYMNLIKDYKDCMLTLCQIR